MTGLLLDMLQVVSYFLWMLMFAAFVMSQKTMRLHRQHRRDGVNLIANVQKENEILRTQRDDQAQLVESLVVVVDQAEARWASQAGPLPLRVPGEQTAHERTQAALDRAMQIAQAHRDQLQREATEKMEKQRERLMRDRPVAAILNEVDRQGFVEAAKRYNAPIRRRYR